MFKGVFKGVFKAMFRSLFGDCSAKFLRKITKNQFFKHKKVKKKKFGFIDLPAAILAHYVLAQASGSCWIACKLAQDF